MQKRRAAQKKSEDAFSNAQTKREETKSHERLHFLSSPIFRILLQTEQCIIASTRIEYQPFLILWSVMLGAAVILSRI